MSQVVKPGPVDSFFLRHEFAIRRLHSLSGLAPVGAYMVVHLLVNSSLLIGASQYQRFVNNIHDLGIVLPLVEWLFILLPIIFHATVGVWINWTGRPNSQVYGYGANVRYTWQRRTGTIALFFIMLHVFHLHGWFHFDWWMKYVAEPLGGAAFRPYNASSTLAIAMGNWIVFGLYVIGLLATTFHFANGIWTAGITWGAWVTPESQRRATKGCAAFGVVLAVIGVAGLVAARRTDIAEARADEDKMYYDRIASGELDPNPHKRSGELRNDTVPTQTSLVPPGESQPAAAGE